MNIKNSLSISIDLTYTEEKYDKSTKRLLSDKYIIAHILKSVVSEFADISIKDIRNLYIEGDILTGVHINSEETSPNIRGMNTQINIYNEGTSTFDLYFTVINPLELSGKCIYINIEAQNDYYPGYDHVTRGVYNCSRMISAQYNTEFSHSHYEQIKKVYSIWICLDPPKKHKNSISVVSLNKKDILSNVDRKKETYDLMTVVSICLGGEEYDNYSGIVKLLDILLKSRLPVEQKKNILEKEFEIPMREEIEEEVESMCHYIQTVFRDAIEEGLEEGLEKGLEEGRRQGIECFILDNIEEGRDENIIVSKLTRRFCINESMAREYVRKYSV